MFKTIPAAGIQALSALISFARGRAAFTVPAHNASCHLYETDGTAAGIMPLLHACCGTFCGGRNMTALGNGRAISSSNTSPNDHVAVLYATDGTAAGTILT